MVNLSDISARETLAQHTIDAIVGGTCCDYFSLFGIHATGSPEVKVIRAFLPGAVQVDIVGAADDEPLASAARLHDDGLFEAFVASRGFFPYRLRVHYPLATVTVVDTYGFGVQLGEMDCYLFNQGTQERAWEFLGANHRRVDGIDGVLFAVWAPNASRVAIVGDFNHWDDRVHVLRKNHECGIWELFIPTDLSGCHYKFAITAAGGSQLPLRADPFARRMQLRPSTASVVSGKGAYSWQDQQWMQERGDRQRRDAPISIYEVHLGSWRRTGNGQEFLTYQDFAEQLVQYVVDMGFSHIQLMPVSEHPFDGSWGYQPIGMFAPSSRFGDPDGLRHLIDTAHRNSIGVLLDWVPGHFPTDEHGLGVFDGTSLYEHADPRRGFHPDWNTLIFDYDRPEVVSYLLSNALYWLSEFHFDGLRFDAVASMLYLDYSRKAGEWLANEYGGRENLGAIKLLRLVNERAYHHYPDIMMIAEESTAWPGVTHMTSSGGLGFGYKWNLGWMNDTLRYMARDSIHKQYHANEITFGLFYAFNENFVLPISHDEVVHGKCSLLEKMPGDDWQKFANLRAFLTFMWSHPGKKLLFMGCEFAQRIEWNHDQSLDWHLLSDGRHTGIQSLVRDLNRVYDALPALYTHDADYRGFEWLEAAHPSGAVFVFARRDPDSGAMAIIACNFTPTVYENFRVGVPEPGDYLECINSNSEFYGGTGQGNLGRLSAEACDSHNRPWSLQLTLPPLATLVLQWEQEASGNQKAPGNQEKATVVDAEPFAESLPGSKQSRGPETL
ncbi:1,4-alpha-glucan branching protein GlgB [Pseudomaricurvus sp. HS19]|uniref:1,4-alpha-glucan branching protein GlgB n=1 Tax=Pseudomaricurvus sp. HS19 TaxID=2692626 RepID=UPI00136C6E61|nr:1,4-alpha-glucan branching protein GlgB [Pseudomaricurvus sp. HS19]MYM63325.1 1,4-alpha-glucan branching protein GlgB [Pseudomaricurvus sp. HS19]